MASGDTLIIIDNPHSYAPPTANYATIDTRNTHKVLDFDDTTDEGAVFECVMPENYAGGGVTVYPHFTMSSATTGNVVLTAAFERDADGGQDIDSDGFATAQSATIAVPGTSGIIESSNSISFTNGSQMDSVVAGDRFRLKVTRDADNASDTASGDLELLAIRIEET